MEISKALKQYVEEIECYHEYMECYEDYKVTYPDHARRYHAMAQEELNHSNMILQMYPELNELIEKIKHHNPK